MVRAYADPKKVRYGIGGEFERAIFLSTGKTVIEFDRNSESFLNNIFDKDLSRAAEFLYALKNDGAVCEESFDGFGGCLSGKLLFYAGNAELYYEKDEDISAVQPPCDPDADQKYSQVKIKAFMWVKGSERSDAMKCLLESAAEVGKSESERFSDFTKGCSVYDFSEGISPLLNDAEKNEEFGMGIIPFIYSAPCKNGEWDSICGYFTDPITGELSTLNNEYQKSIFE